MLSAQSGYVRDKPRITYVQPTDPWMIRQCVSALEVLFGRRRMEAVYHELKAPDFDLGTFFDSALNRAGLTVNYDHAQLAKIPKSDPLVLVANHPFGILDGLILCDLALKARGDFRIMINALLCQDKDLAPYFLPIDFDNTKAAVKNNIAAKKMALEAIKDNIPVIVFPSGMVSTADGMGLGKVIDGPWTTFAAKLIRDGQANVVPVYFPGCNSRKFHIASHIAEPLRMALLVHEALNKFGSTIDVHIGDTLYWETLAPMGNRQELTDHLYAAVQATNPSGSSCTDATQLPGKSRR